MISKYYDLAFTSSAFYYDLTIGFENGVNKAANNALRTKVTGYPRHDLIDVSSKPYDIVLYAPSWNNEGERW